MDIRPSPWAGVITPSSNPTVEPELARCLDSAMTLYTARLPVMPGTTLEQRNPRYLEAYPDCVRAFGDLALSGIAIAMTGASYRLLPEGDRALMRELSATAKVPVITASAAVADALRALGARRVCLVSPYPKWLTTQAVTYWQTAGHDVRQVVEISETFRAYALTNQEVADALARVAHEDVDAVIMSGTGMLTLPAILDARETVKTPIVSANLGCAYALLANAGLREGSPLFAQAAPELAQALANRRS